MVPEAIAGWWRLLAPTVYNKCADLQTVLECSPEDWEGYYRWSPALQIANRWLAVQLVTLLSARTDEGRALRDDLRQAEAHRNGDGRAEIRFYQAKLTRARTTVIFIY